MTEESDRIGHIDLPPEIARLVMDLHKPLAQFYAEGEPSHERAYDAMAALAICAAMIIVGTEAEMYKWFGEAVYAAVNKMSEAVTGKKDPEPKGTLQ